MEPLPCPFCGKKPEVRKALNIPDAYIVVCAFVECEILPASKWFSSIGKINGKDEAIASWNKRANPQFGHTNKKLTLGAGKITEIIRQNDAQHGVQTRGIDETNKIP